MTRNFSLVVAITIALGAMLVAWPRVSRQNKQDESGRIVGRVIERDTGAPLAAELGVAMRTSRGLTLRHARASEQGIIELAGLPAAAVQLSTKFEGYAVERQSLSLGEGELRQLEFHLVRLVTVRGRVEDERGEPAPNALIQAGYARDAAADGPIGATYQWEQAGEVRSDEQGRYAIAVHPERAFTLEVSHTEFQAFRRTMDPAASREPVLLKLKPKQRDER
jgi:hypothetical protein